jgi:EmrB/QacA subfamily drug resistance transporter
MIGTVLAALDTSIVSTTLPTIAGKLGAVGSYSWAGTSYILTATIATPILGKLGDLYGRRPVVLGAILLFVVASVLCSLARNMAQLTAARGLQGLGGGGIQALTFAILGDLVSPRERGRYMGLYTGIYAASAVLGPLLGGWMISQFSWPWIFVINLPVGAIALVAISATLKIPVQRRKVQIDIRGAVLLATTLGAFTVAVTAGKDGWTKSLVGWSFAVSVVAFVLFIREERRAPEPIVPLRLFGNRVFAIASAMGFLAGSMAFGAQQFLPLQFQDANFYSPTKSGLALAPIMIGILLGSGLGGRWTAKTGRYKIIPVIGVGLTVLGVFVFTQLSPYTSWWILVLPMLGIGIGNGATFTTTSIATQNAIDVSDIGIGTATLVSFRSLGGSLGLALYGTLFNATLATSLRAGLPIRETDRTKDVLSIVRDPEMVKRLPIPIRSVVARSVTDGTAKVFLAALPVAVLALVLAVALPELPLRKTAQPSTAPSTALD